jgi:ubiquinone/menaquinone biosynthesis C-methylase UbiE
MSCDLHTNFSYETHTWGHSINRKSYDFPRLKFDILLKILKPHEPKKILEVGCGAGKFIFSLAEEFPATSFTGIDISNSAISKANQKNNRSNVHFLIGDAQKMNFDSDSFDAVILLDVLEHVKDPEKVIHDCCRFLKPGGIIHAFIPCEAHSIYWLGEKIFGFHTKEKVVGHVQRFTRRKANALIETKMTIIDIRYSFHLIGSIMDYALFSALLNKSFSERFWSVNKFYGQRKKKSIFSGLLNAALTLGSYLAYFESLLLRRFAFTATGVHITAIKK